MKINQKDKWGHQEAGISMGQENSGTKNPESVNRGNERKVKNWMP